MASSKFQKLGQGPEQGFGPVFAFSDRMAGHAALARAIKKYGGRRWFSPLVRMMWSNDNKTPPIWVLNLDLSDRSL